VEVVPATVPSVNVNVGISLRISQLLNPRFGAFPSPRDVAKYFCKVLATIGAEKLPVKIYLDHRVTERIAPILRELGIKFRTVPVERMEPPYIFFFIDEETGRLVVETCDPDLKKRSFVTRFDLFLDELTLLLTEARKKKAEERERKKELPRIEVLKDMSPKEFLELMKDILGEE
jgi:hypothetical protein